jgi:hypothetical protein
VISTLKALPRRAGRLIRPPIVQFGPPRSGSTLVYNVIREGYPERTVLKEHWLTRYYRHPWSRAPIVCTVRHPLDVVASRIQVDGDMPTTESIERNLQAVAHYRLLLRIRHDPRVLTLRYESFVNDFDYLFDQLEQFLDERIDNETKTNIRGRYDLDEVRQKAKRLGSFENWDREDHIHGNHISAYGGRVGYYTEFFGSDQIRRMEEHFREVLAAFEYDVTV